MNIRFLVLLAFFIPTLVFASTAKPIRSQLLPSEPLLKDPALEILAVEVVEINNEGRTRANPPTARIKVLEVLRGPDSRRGEYRAIWQATVKPSDLVGQQLNTSWYEEPMVGPSVGTTMLTFVQPISGDVLILQAESAYLLSEKNKQTVLENMEHASAKQALQGALFWIILSVPLVELVIFAVIYRKKSLPPKAATRAKLALVSIGLSLLAFALYAAYELSIPTFSNIRADLVLIFPALALCLLQLAIATRRVVRYYLTGKSRSTSR